jgi:hypothetical protein
MAGGKDWRYACVTRAQTIARGTRMIDLAVEGRLHGIPSRSRAHFAVIIGGRQAVRSYDCIAAPNGLVRAVLEAGADDGLRFMWSLVEGAVLRMALPQMRPASDACIPPETKARYPFPILAVNDAIILGKGGGNGAIRTIVANSSIV